MTKRAKLNLVAPGMWSTRLNDEVTANVSHQKRGLYAVVWFVDGRPVDREIMRDGLPNVAERVADWLP